MRWSNVRMNHATMEALCVYRDKILACRATRPDQFPAYLGDDVVSIGNVIRFLLDQRNRHAERSRKSKANQAWNQVVSLVESVEI